MAESDSFGLTKPFCLVRHLRIKLAEGSQNATRIIAFASGNSNQVKLGSKNCSLTNFGMADSKFDNAYNPHVEVLAALPNQ